MSPVNPAYTVDELKWFLRDSGAKVVVCERGLVGVVREALSRLKERKGVRVLVIDDEIEGGVTGGGRDLKSREEINFQKFLAKPNQQTLKAKIDPDKDLAFLVYSSGTTGLPKGVMLTHANVVADMYMVADREGWNGGGKGEGESGLRWDRDRILSVLPFYHIYGLFIPLSPLFLALLFSRK